MGGGEGGVRKEVIGRGSTGTRSQAQVGTTIPVLVQQGALPAPFEASHVWTCIYPQETEKAKKTFMQLFSMKAL